MERLSLFWKIVILLVVVIGFTLVSPQRIPPSRSNVDTSNLLDIKPHELQKFVAGGSGLKLLYFYTNEQPTNPEFVEELNKAAAHLHTQKYGVKVAKVDCREHGLSFCKEKSIQSNVFAL
ncbi:uncharacterized protein LOC111089161, partial [Limulus polyphemus]|uniref:Uncharacterized protein LOC111089161 n=1 Tax=Limulus polyphemus TaxID=6850 RepID=A0ABM1TLQ4_LIMPO